MAQKIIYFTAGAVATAEELSEIAALNALAETPYLVQVSNAAVPAGLGKDSEGAEIIEQCDFVAGSIPAAYSEIAEFDPQNPPAPDLPDDQAVVTDGGTLNVDGVSVTLAVSGNAVTGTTLPATNAIIADAGTIPVQNSEGAAIGTGTLTVAANEPSNIKLPATIAGVANGAAVTIQNSAGAAVAGTHSATVASGVVSNVKLAATIAPVANGSQNITDAAGKASTATRTVSAGAITTTVLAATDSIVKDGNSFTAADGGTITVAVAAGVPTFTYTAP